jgi:hypothetical protein
VLQHFAFYYKIMMKKIKIHCLNYYVLRGIFTFHFHA